MITSLRGLKANAWTMPERGQLSSSVENAQRLSNVIARNPGLKSFTLVLTQGLYPSAALADTSALEMLGYVVPPLDSLSITGPLSFSKQAQQSWAPKFANLRTLSLSFPTPIVEFGRFFRGKLPHLRELRLEYSGKYGLPIHHDRVSQFAALLSGLRPTKLHLESFDLDTILHTTQLHRPTLESLFFYGGEGFQGLLSQAWEPIRPVLWHSHVRQGFEHEVEAIRLIRDNFPTLREFGTRVRMKDLVALRTHGLTHEASDVDRNSEENTIDAKVPTTVNMARSNSYQILDEFAKFKHLRHIFLNVGDYGLLLHRLLPYSLLPYDPYPNGARDLVHTFVYLQERKHGVRLETLTAKIGPLGWVVYYLDRKHASVKSYDSHLENCTLQVWNTETLRIHEEHVMECGQWKGGFADAGLGMP